MTVSDTRTEQTDESGAAIRERLVGHGHEVAVSLIVPDEGERIAASVRELVDDRSVDAILLSGGTGVSPRDNTHEAVAPLLTRRIEGFGELFRMLSFEEIGSAAMLSRALAGVIEHTVVFALPGSTAACRLAMERLIIPELGHVVSLANPEKWSERT